MFIYEPKRRFLGRQPKYNKIMYVVVKINWQKGSFSDKKGTEIVSTILLVKRTDSSKNRTSRTLLVWLVEIVMMD